MFLPDVYFWQQMPVVRYFAGLERLRAAQETGTLNDYIGARGLARLAQETGESKIGWMFSAFGGSRSDLERALSQDQSEVVRLTLPDDGLQWFSTQSTEANDLTEDFFQEQDSERTVAELETLIDGSVETGILQLYFPQEDTFGIHYITSKGIQIPTLLRDRPYEIVSGVSKHSLERSFARSVLTVRPVGQTRSYTLKSIKDELVRIYEPDSFPSTTQKLTLEKLGVAPSASMEEKLEALGIDPETLHGYSATPIELSTIHSWVQAQSTSLEIRYIDAIGIHIVYDGDRHAVSQRLEQVEHRIVGKVTPFASNEPYFREVGKRLGAQMPRGQEQVELMSAVDGRSGFWSRSKRIFTGAVRERYVAGSSAGRISYTTALELYKNATEGLQHRLSQVVVYVPSLKQSLIIPWNPEVREYLRRTHHHVLLIIAGRLSDAKLIVEQLQGQPMHYWAKWNTNKITALKKVERGQVQQFAGDVHLQNTYGGEGTDFIPAGVVVGRELRHAPPALQGVDSQHHQDQIREWANTEFGAEKIGDPQFTMLGTMVQEVWIRTTQGYVGVAYQGRPDTNWESAKRSDMLAELERLQQAASGSAVEMRNGQLAPMPQEKVQETAPKQLAPEVVLPDDPGKLSLSQLQSKLEATTATSIVLLYFPTEERYATYELSSVHRIRHPDQTYVFVAGVSRQSLGLFSSQIMKFWLHGQGNPYLLKSVDSGLVRWFDGDGTRSSTQQITRDTLGLSSSASVDEVLAAIGIDPASTRWRGTERKSLEEVSNWPESATKSLKVVDLVGLGVQFVYETGMRGAVDLAIEQVDHVVVGKVVPYALRANRFPVDGKALAGQLPKSQSVVELRSSKDDQSAFWNSAGERIFTGAAVDGDVAYANPEMPADPVIYGAYDKAMEGLEKRVTYVLIHIASRNEFMLVAWNERVRKYLGTTSDQVLLVVAYSPTSLNAALNQLPGRSAYFWMNGSTGAVIQVEPTAKRDARILSKTPTAIEANREKHLEQVVSEARPTDIGVLTRDTWKAKVLDKDAFNTFWVELKEFAEQGAEASSTQLLKEFSSHLLANKEFLAVLDNGAIRIVTVPRMDWRRQRRFQDSSLAHFEFPRPGETVIYHQEFSLFESTIASNVTLNVLVTELLRRGIIQAELEEGGRLSIKIGDQPMQLGFVDPEEYQELQDSLDWLRQHKKVPSLVNEAQLRYVLVTKPIARFLVPAGRFRNSGATDALNRVSESVSKIPPPKDRNRPLSAITSIPYNLFYDDALSVDRQPILGRLSDRGIPNVGGCCGLRNDLSRRDAGKRYSLCSIRRSELP